MARTAKTVCNRDCPDACTIVATIDDAGKVVRLGGDPESDLTRGFLCFRTSHFLETQYDPRRLTTPLIRRRGKLEAATWDEALDLIASKLLAIRAESGPAAIFHYRSGGSLGILLHLTEMFWEKFGPVTVKRGDICSGAGDAAQTLDFGDEDANDLEDLEHAKSIVLWGKNVFTSSPHLIPRLKEARARGAKIVLIDPVHHKTASIADTFVQPRPGGDFALAMAIMARVVERGGLAADAAAVCDHLPAFLTLVGSKPAAVWAAEADVTPAELELLTDLYVAGRPTTTFVGWGMGRRENGAAIVRAIDALATVTGNVGLPGTGVSYYFKRRGAFAASFTGAARTVCEPTFGADVMAAQDPPIRAIWITAGNPVAMLPDSEVTARALASRELVVVADSVLTDTAELADVVLPTPTLLEADDVVGAYGHAFLGVARPVVPPPPGVKSDLEILQALAPRLGLAGVLDGDARTWKDRLLRPEVKAAGVTIDRLEAGPVRNPLAPRVVFEGRRFKTASGRANLIHEAPSDAATDPDRAHAAELPLVLMALSTERSQSSQWVRHEEGPPTLTVHPDAAPVADGELARVETRTGSLVVRVAHDPKQRRDIALLPKGGHRRDARCANVLIRARTTDLGEGGALNDQRCRLVAVELPAG